MASKVLSINGQKLKVLLPIHSIDLLSNHKSDKNEDFYFSSEDDSKFRSYGFGGHPATRIALIDRYLRGERNLPSTNQHNFLKAIKLYLKYSNKINIKHGFSKRNGYICVSCGKTRPDGLSVEHECSRCLR